MEGRQKDRRRHGCDSDRDVKVRRRSSVLSIVLVWLWSETVIAVVLVIDKFS